MISDYNLVFASESEWELNKSMCDGEIDVIGMYNDQFLVNVRGSIHDDLIPFTIQPESPLRVWF